MRAVRVVAALALLFAAAGGAYRWMNAEEDGPNSRATWKATLPPGFIVPADACHVPGNGRAPPQKRGGS